MSLFGDKRTLAFELKPLGGPPPEGDGAAAATWAELQIWLNGESLTRHVHTEDGRYDDGLHWPVIYLARWFVRSWPRLFEQQRWPLPGWFRNARDVCNALDERLVDMEDAADASAQEEALDAFAEARDAFVSTHALAAGAAGGLVPDIYFARDGDRVSVALGASRAHPSVWFLHERGEHDVPVPLFVDAVGGLVRWTLEQIQTRSDPASAEDRLSLSAWLDTLETPSAAEAVLFGYIGFDRETLHQMCEPAGGPIAGQAMQGNMDMLLELDPGWQKGGARFDPSRSGAAMVFRALSPCLEAGDVLGILQTLSSYPKLAPAEGALDTMRRKLPWPAGQQADYLQGYRLAETVREQLDNPTGYFDIEALLRSWGIGIEEIEISNADVDGGAVWDDEHGPVIVVNRRSPRANVPWGRRMVLAHELCHLLVDRGVGVPLKVISGAWAPPLLERRANAFAAELLLPRAGVVHQIGSPKSLPDDEELARLMDTFGIGRMVCIEHIQNRFRLEPSAQLYRSA